MTNPETRKRLNGLLSDQHNLPVCPDCEEVLLPYSECSTFDIVNKDIGVGKVATTLPWMSCPDCGNIYLIWGQSL